MLELHRPGWRRRLTLGVIAVHGMLVQVSRGRLLGRLAGMEVVLLTTTGRRTGRPRTTTLTAIPDGERVLLVGSAGGSEQPPAWALNLEADGRCALERRGRRSAWVARRTEGEERDRAWALVVARYSGYASYQDRTARVIPVFALVPVADGADGARDDSGPPPREVSRRARG